MDPYNTYNEPSDVAAEHGEVIVDGPDGVAVSLTPEAAIETSHRLLDRGLAAHGQKIEKARRAKPGAPFPQDRCDPPRQEPGDEGGAA